MHIPMSMIPTIILPKAVAKYLISLLCQYTYTLLVGRYSIINIDCGFDTHALMFSCCIAEWLRSILFIGLLRNLRCSSKGSILAPFYIDQNCYQLSRTPN